MEHSLELQRALAGLATQVLKRIRSEEQLLHEAMNDKLTGLANRHMQHVGLGKATGGGNSPQADFTSSVAL